MAGCAAVMPAKLTSRWVLGRVMSNWRALVQDDVGDPPRLVGLQLRVQLLVHQRRGGGGDVRPQAVQQRVQPVHALEIREVDPGRQVLRLQDLLTHRRVRATITNRRGAVDIVNASG